MSTSAAASVVHLSDAGHTYGSGERAVVAVHGINGIVDPSARFAITGPSGSGKSTLLHLMAGLESPTTGEVGWPTFGSSPAGRPLEAGVIFQGPSLIPSLTVVENIALPLILAGRTDRDARERAAQALARLDLAWLGGKLPDEISGGQAQRAAIARVLATRPALILADEPTGQLDHATGAAMMDVLIETADEIGAALVVSTHDEFVAERMRTRWIMSDGTIVATELTSSVMAGELS